MDEFELKTLLKKLDEGTCSAEEIGELKDWHISQKKAKPANAGLPNVIEGADDILTRLQVAEQKKARLWSQLVITASTVITIGAALWFYGTSSYPRINRYSLVANQSDIPPGKYQAILTLANGKTINLSNAYTGVVIDASELTYYDGSNANATNHLSQSGTITTPRGGQYRITLPDGTSVWLNAASSLRFSLISGKIQTRNVELSGEAYFEIAKDSRRPFIVKTAQQEVEVLGTHFNISSYPDEGITKTTLINGSLRVVNRNSKIEGILRPGQQSIVVKDKLTIEPADIECVLAWKDGYFKFAHNENITEIMPKVARWYNVKVVYQGDMNDVNFTGTVSRFKNISSLLEKIALTSQVKFQIDEGLITVIKK